MAWINASHYEQSESIPLTGPLLKFNDAGDEVNGSLSAGWPILLLPFFDRLALMRQIQTDVISLASLEGGKDNHALEHIAIPEFKCLCDPGVLLAPGRMSYVGNSGFIDREIYHGDPELRHHLGMLSWNGNEIGDEPVDISTSAATGVMWPHSVSFKQSKNRIDADGTSQTVLFTENIQAGNWFDLEVARIGFGLPIPNDHHQVRFGQMTFFESLKKPLNTEFEGGALTTILPQDWRVNSDRSAALGTRPRPSSHHPGGANCVFADGSCRFLGKDIDPCVYVRILTPNGSSFGENTLSIDSIRLSEKVR